MLNRRLSVLAKKEERAVHRRERVGLGELRFLS
jgi:hypothetical protein